jgi:hypothetical protein
MNMPPQTEGVAHAVVSSFSTTATTTTASSGYPHQDGTTCEVKLTGILSTGGSPGQTPPGQLLNGWLTP